MHLPTLLLITLLASTYTLAIDVARIKSELKRLLHEKDIPDGVAHFVAALHEGIDILRCVPTIKSGNCYKSNICQVPKLSIEHKAVSIVLSICKKPYQLIINFMPFDLPSWVTLDLHPLVVNFNNDVSGALAVTSNTEVKLKVRHIHIGVAKARFMINGYVRYDCTKPRSDWIRRAVENRKAPNQEYNKLYYRLHVRIEIKVKHFDHGKFRYHCKTCKDLVNKSGTLGHGPRSCIADVERHNRFINCWRQCFANPACRDEPDDCEVLCDRYCRGKVY